MDPQIISKITRVHPRFQTVFSKTGKHTTGPYWYGYWQENGKSRQVYIGRQLPEELHALFASRYLRPGHRNITWPGRAAQA